MDTFENMEFSENDPQEQQPQPLEEPEAQHEPMPQQDTAYHGSGAGRKESPYANSPYERMPQFEEPYRYQPQPKPQKPKKQRKPR